MAPGSCAPEKGPGVPDPRDLTEDLIEDHVAREPKILLPRRNPEGDRPPLVPIDEGDHRGDLVSAERCPEEGPDERRRRRKLIEFALAGLGVEKHEAPVELVIDRALPVRLDLEDLVS